MECGIVASLLGLDGREIEKMSKQILKTHLGLMHLDSAQTFDGLSLCNFKELCNPRLFFRVQTRVTLIKKWNESYLKRNPRIASTRCTNIASMMDLHPICIRLIQFLHVLSLKEISSYVRSYSSRWCKGHYWTQSIEVEIRSFIVGHLHLCFIVRAFIWSMITLQVCNHAIGRK